jgi:hypothetical protein
VHTDDTGFTQARDVVDALIGAPAEIERLVGGGRNSRIYHVQSGSKEFALKQYPSRADDPRDRLSTEVGALNLMERYHIDSVPRVVGVDHQRGFALLSWIDGAAVTDIVDADIDAAAHFLATVHKLGNTPWAKEQPPAAEACLSGVEIERQVRGRLARLEGMRGEGALAGFLGNDLVPVFERESVGARAKIQAAGLDFAADLPQEWQSLVPSDFGFHNSLRRKDGSLAFVDFEYFGWDDPVKLSADILLHPGRTLAAPQRLRFRRAACELYGKDPCFAERLDAYLPLFGLRWVLILLNEFIPERWQRRVLAGAGESWADAKTTQLALASDFLAALPGKVKDA